MTTDVDVDVDVDGFSAARGDHGRSVPRVLIAKVGLDGHDRGVKVVARCLRDAGMEVIYTGLHRSAEEVVHTAVQEDVDVIGVSLLSGAHMTHLPRIIDLMRDNGIFEQTLLIAGGVMPDEDVEALKDLGVAEILGQETEPQTIVQTVARLIEERDRRVADVR
jgi:methylmalonyl-CoA mutase cobalamin-binding domain/chain